MQVEYSEARRNGISWTLSSATPNTPIKGLEVTSSANNNVGRQIWMFEEKSGEDRAFGKRIPEARATYQKTSETIRHSADEVYRSLCADKRKDSCGGISQDTTKVPHMKRVGDALSNAAKYLCSLQEPDGHWPGDYGGPLFLLPGSLFHS
jgi:cycloartenol synthase